MFPTIIHLGPVPIHSYGLMMAVGFLVSLYLMRRDAPRFGLDADAIGDGAFWGLLVGIVGSRIFHIVMFRGQYFGTGLPVWRKAVGLIAVWEGGLVFQGAIPAVLVFVWWYGKRKDLPFFKTTDMVIPYIALAHGLGRFGCFLNGCCYGGRTDAPWAVRFPKGSPAYIDHVKQFGLVPGTAEWSLPIHPTQLYSIIALVLLCIVLVQLRNRWQPFHGSVFCVYLILYSAFRFVNEALRADHNPVRIFGLSDQQVFSLLGVVAGIILMGILWKLMPRSVPIGRSQSKSAPATE